MRRSNPVVITTACFLLGCIPEGGLLAAAEITPPDAPPPPNRILDEGRVFAFDSGAREKISADLQDAYERYGLDAYIAAYSFLLDETIEERAEALQKAWAGHSKGLVLVYVTGSEQMTFAASEDVHEFLPRFELLELFNAAAVLAKQSEKSSERIKAACDQVIGGIVGRMETKRGKRSVLNRELLTLASIVLTAVLALFAAGILYSRFQQELESRQSEFFYFPQVHVGNRFGASHGGGSLAEVDFAGASNPQAPEAGPSRPNA